MNIYLKYLFIGQLVIAIHMIIYVLFFHDEEVKLGDLLLVTALISVWPATIMLAIAVSSYAIIDWLRDHISWNLVVFRPRKWKVKEMVSRMTNGKNVQKG